MTRREKVGTGREVPIQLDAALRETMALLELVQREDEVHAAFERCLLDLRAIRVARAALVGRTWVELDEASQVLGSRHSGTGSEPGPVRIGAEDGA